MLENPQNPTTGRSGADTLRRVGVASRSPSLIVRDRVKRTKAAGHDARGLLQEGGDPAKIVLLTIVPEALHFNAWRPHHPAPHSPKGKPTVPSGATTMTRLG